MLARSRHATTSSVTCTAGALPFPQCVHDTLALAQKHIKLIGPHKGRPGNAAKTVEMQAMIDQNLFCLVSGDKKRSRLTEIQQLQLLGILAEYFRGKQDDPHKYSYFELIFLGKENDPVAHSGRVQMIFRLASFALQYPVHNIFVQICQWLSKPGLSMTHGEQLINILTEQFINAKPALKLYEFLLPVESVSADFTVLFLTFAVRSEYMGLPLIIVCSSYMNKHMSFILNSYRDAPEMSEMFCKKSFPLLLEYDLKNDVLDEDHEILHTSMLGILDGWKDKENLPVTISMADPEHKWTIRKCALISRASLNTPLGDQIRRECRELKVPEVFQHLVVL